MRAIVFLFSTLLILQSCNSDFILTRQMVGKYKVSLATADTREQIERKKEEVKKKTEEAKKKIDKSIEEKKSNIDKDAPFAEGLSSLLDGLGKVAKGAAELGEAVSDLTLNIGEELIDLSAARLQLNEDGTGHFGTKKWGGNIQWKIENGQLYLWGDDEDLSIDMDGMTIEKIDADNFDLIGDNVKIHLQRVEDDK